MTAYKRAIRQAINDALQAETRINLTDAYVEHLKLLASGYDDVVNAMREALDNNSDLLQYAQLRHFKNMRDGYVESLQIILTLRNYSQAQLRTIQQKMPDD